MKIYISHSRGFDFKAELYQPLQADEIFAAHDFVLPHAGSDAPYLLKDRTHEFDLVLAEVSFPSTGQGIELGWFDVAGKPIICFYQAGTKYSGSLRTVSNAFYEYEDPAKLISKIRSVISELSV